MENSDCVIMFVKFPEPGTVKTRLAVSLGDKVTLDLYKCFVGDILEMLESGGHPPVIFFYPPDSRQRIVQWLGDKYTMFPQKGYDLGERMATAFETMFSRGLDSAILIGSDSPDLPMEIIHDALTSLKDHDLVIGPSYDGGYYLIGFRADRFFPKVFDGIPWSTPEVFMQTIDILRKAHLRVHILPTRRDVDTLDDLKALFSVSHDMRFAKSATMDYIMRNMRDYLP